MTTNMKQLEKALDAQVKKKFTQISIHYSEKLNEFNEQFKLLVLNTIKNFALLEEFIDNDEMKIDDLKIKTTKNDKEYKNSSNIDAKVLAAKASKFSSSSKDNVKPEKLVDKNSSKNKWVDENNNDFDNYEIPEIKEEADSDYGEEPVMGDGLDVVDVDWPGIFSCEECDFSCDYSYQLEDHKWADHKQVLKNTKNSKEKEVENEEEKSDADSDDNSSKNKKRKNGDIIVEGKSPSDSRFKFKYEGERIIKDKVSGLKKSSALIKSEIVIDKNGNKKKVREYRCETCEKTFAYKQNMDIHILTKHLKQLPYKCTDCTYQTAYKMYLSKHVKRIHDNIRDVECTEYFADQFGMVTKCEYATSERAVLKRHIKAVHDKIKDAFCPEGCGYATSERTDLRKHVKAVHDKIRDCICPSSDCEFATSEKTDLHRHMRRKHNMNSDGIVMEGDFDEELEESQNSIELEN